MHPRLPNDPLELDAGFRHSLVQPFGRSTEDVLAIPGVDAQCEKRFASQLGRTGRCRLRLPGGPSIVGADRADPAIGWESVDDARPEYLVRVSLAGTDVNAGQVSWIDGDGPAHEAGAGEVSRVHVEPIHQGDPRGPSVIGSEYPAIG